MPFIFPIACSCWRLVQGTASAMTSTRENSFLPQGRDQGPTRHKYLPFSIYVKSTLTARIQATEQMPFQVHFFSEKKSGGTQGGTPPSLIYIVHVSSPYKETLLLHQLYNLFSVFDSCFIFISTSTRRSD